MKWADYIFFVTSDLFRYGGKSNLSVFLMTLTCIPGFKYTFLMRTANYLKSKGVAMLPLYGLFRFFLNRYQFKYGINIPYNTEIGPGFYIGHFGGITINCEARIGRNCNINQGVTIGVTYGGKYPGSPVVGDNVYIGPGAFIIGGIEIGNHAAIGANTVVNKPIPDNGVVVGPPGEIISHKGSGSYIVNIDY